MTPSWVSMPDVGVVVNARDFAAALLQKQRGVNVQRAARRRNAVELTLMCALPDDLRSGLVARNHAVEDLSAGIWKGCLPCFRSLQTLLTRHRPTSANFLFDHVRSREVQRITPPLLIERRNPLI